jgi:hypothetical protein
MDPVFLATFVEKAVLSPLCVFEFIVKDDLAVAVWVYVRSSILIHWFSCLFLCQCHVVFIVMTLWLCSIVWSWELWYLQHWSFCSELPWLFEIFCVFICILELIFLSLCRMSLEFYRDCIEHVDCFWVTYISVNLCSSFVFNVTYYYDHNSIYSQYATW